MDIAFVTSDIRGETDRILAAAAAELEATGATLAGIVRDDSHESRFANGCDMKVRVLSDGHVVQITQDLGSGSDACRLDPGAIAEAVARVEAGALERAGLFLLNKFGPEECAGRGFVSAIGRAVEADVPVLVGVGRASIAAFSAFSGGLAVALPAERGAVLDWCHEVMRQKVS